MLTKSKGTKTKMSSEHEKQRRELEALEREISEGKAAIEDAKRKARETSKEKERMRANLTIEERAALVADTGPAVKSRYDRSRDRDRDDRDGSREHGR